MSQTKETKSDVYEDEKISLVVFMFAYICLAAFITFVIVSDVSDTDAKSIIVAGAFFTSILCSTVCITGMVILNALQKGNSQNN